MPPRGVSAIAKLSDFGAAFFYGDVADGAVYERMEQRAFGLLLDELLERHDGSEPHHLLSVRAVAAVATSEAAESRPGFSELLSVLSAKEGRRNGTRRPRSTFGRVLPHGHSHAR